MLDGNIDVSSEPGKGSTFTLSINPGSLKRVSMLSEPPASTEQDEEPPSVDHNSLDGRVLLAEDGLDNQRLIAFILGKAGLQVDLAENGRIACECAALSAAEGRPYDLILMDIQMPELDGLEATRRLRQAGWSHPIVALTAHAMTGDREKCLEAGCNDYMTKPIDRKTFLPAVKRYLDEARRNRLQRNRT